MIDDTLQYLAISQNEVLNELLRTHYGNALHVCADLIEVEETVRQRWPQALIVDVESTQATAQWCYTFRQHFPIAEIPLILFQEQSDPTLEQQVSHLNRLSILSSSDLDSVTTFVDILIDAYVRDPFYERQAQLLTLERVTQLWLNHNCGQMFYTRFNDDYVGFSKIYMEVDELQQCVDNGWFNSTQLSNKEACVTSIFFGKLFLTISKP